MAQEIEKLFVEGERFIGCVVNLFFWGLFVIFGAILGVIGWLLYTNVIVNHPLPGDAHQKDALILGLGAAVLSFVLSAIILNLMSRAILRWASNRTSGRQKKN